MLKYTNGLVTISCDEREHILHFPNKLGKFPISSDLVNLCS